MPVRKLKPDEQIKVRVLPAEERIPTSQIGPPTGGFEAFINQFSELEEEPRPSFQMPRPGGLSPGEQTGSEAVLGTLLSLGARRPVPGGEAVSAARPLAQRMMEFLGQTGKAAAGAGTGVGATRMGQEIAEGAPLGEAAQTGAKTGLEMAAAEMAGATLFKGLEKIAAPVARKITQEGKELLDFARRHKLSFQPSRVTDSMLSKAVEGGSDAFLAGRLTNDVMRRTAVKRFNQLQRALPEEVGRVRGVSEIAPLTRQAFTDVTGGIERQAKTLAGEFLETLPKGSETKVPIQEFKRLLKDIDKQAKSPALKRFISEELDSIGRNTVKTAENLETTMRQIGSARVSGVDRKYLTQMREAIKEAFQESGADMGKLEAANKFFAKNRGLLGTRTAKRLKTLEGKPGFIPDQAITVEVFKSGNEGLIKQLDELAKKGEFDPTLWNDLKAQNIANLLENSSKEVPGMFGTRFLDGNKLEKILASNQSIFKQAYSPETLKSLSNMAKIAKATADDVRILSGNRTLSTTALAELNLGVGAGGMLTNVIGPSGIMLTQGLSIPMAHSLMNPNGVMKQWLTTGLPLGEVTKQAVTLPFRGQGGE